jgi:hypothetical protein
VGGWGRPLQASDERLLPTVLRRMLEPARPSTTGYAPVKLPRLSSLDIVLVSPGCCKEVSQAPLGPGGGRVTSNPIPTLALNTVDLSTRGSRKVERVPSRNAAQAAFATNFGGWKAHATPRYSFVWAPSVRRSCGAFREGTRSTLKSTVLTLALPLKGRANVRVLAPEP